MEAPAAPRDPAESFESPKPFESSESSESSDFSGSSDFSESSRSFESAPGVEITVTSPEQMRELGRRLATVLRAGDLLMLSGELGAGKTTLTRGLGEGMGVRGAVTSPTFVIARVHPSLGDGPPLVHVDAYRLSGGLDEMEDLDLDVSLPDSVIVVEWGEGKVEELTDDRLRLRIDRAVGDTTDEVRHVTLTGIGERWAAADLSVLAV
ncbi:tRNA (adenosine(37)-N6)-threonylcarbamoyltransferase complex ATPase subunit type 1 TsaE [Streptomyces sp. NPDC017230]|uniref:tRNA (adenosine(37)-N6)-threonylcarbamoyltransferase complex ATPase subunit type 1 TsaE n=2 Tax=unclassified Streptomyces TaxID=2593676 RepID=UPI00378F8FB2